MNNTLLSFFLTLIAASLCGIVYAIRCQHPLIVDAVLEFLKYLVAFASIWFIGKTMLDVIDKNKSIRKG